MLATTQQLNDPETVLVDSSGNLYISEQSGFESQSSTCPMDTLTVLAGNGEIGYSGDNGLAVNAALDEPTGIALGLQRLSLHLRHDE